MYYRIKNKLDTEIIGESLKSEMIGRAVMERVGELAAILDREYGCCVVPLIWEGTYCFLRSHKPMRVMFQESWSAITLIKICMNIHRK